MSCCSLLLVDDERDILSSYSAMFRYHGFSKIYELDESDKTLEYLDKYSDIGAIVLDLNMPLMSGKEILEKVSEKNPELPVIVVTGRDRARDAVECLRLGAFDYLTKPVESEDLISVVRKAVAEKLSEVELKNPDAFDDIVTSDDGMNKLFHYIESIRNSTMSMLILGESGTGKELLAKGIYKSHNYDGELVPVNVAGLDDTVFTDTLFGHVKGAYTGAHDSRKGLIAKAENGLLFLDEIGDLTPASQLKLLRLLQEREYSPLGSDEVYRTTARIVAATNVDLEEKVVQGTFREDLFFRLKTHLLTIPPLRKRKGDIALLAQKFIRTASTALGKKMPFIPKELYPLLSSYDFPGNVRELHSLMLDTVARHTGGPVLSIQSVKEYCESKGDSPLDFSDAPISYGDELPKLKDVEDFLLKEAMEKTNNNQSEAAKMLGVSQSKISRHMKKGK